MAKKTTTEAKLDHVNDKTAEQLHAEWLRCLEESALAHKELKEARQDLRKALESWAERQASGPLTDDGAARVNRKLLKAHNGAKQAGEVARVARDAEAKAWEAQGLPASRNRVPDDLEAV